MTPSQEEYRLIPLTQGQQTLVSLCDYEWLMLWKWYARWNPAMGSFYACRKIKRNGKTITIQMHRQILGLESGDPRKGDHIKGNTLDNRRSQLRIATHSQNLMNHKLRSDNKCGHSGISFFSRTGRYRVYLKVDGKQLHVGYFLNLNAAIEARREAIRIHYGEFARFE